MVLHSGKWVGVHLGHLVHRLLEISTDAHRTILFNHWDNGRGPVRVLDRLNHTNLYQSVKFHLHFSTRNENGTGREPKNLGGASGFTCNLTYTPFSFPGHLQRPQSDSLRSYSDLDLRYAHSSELLPRSASVPATSSAPGEWVHHQALLTSSIASAVPQKRLLPGASPLLVSVP